MTWQEGTGNNVSFPSIVELTFHVKENFSGKTNITLTYDPDDVFNEDDKNVAFEVINGVIEAFPRSKEDNSSGRGEDATIPNPGQGNQAGNLTSDEIESILSKEGCYVATAVYGSYDCPEVWTLRRFRDNVLGKTWYGRLFIKLYYAVSPTAVKLFGNCEWFQNFFRDKLDSMVSKLQSDGFESTPYQDRSW